MKGCPTSKIIELLWGSCSVPWVYNITIWPDCDVQLTLVTQSVIAPANVTNLTSTDSNGWAYDCGNPILNWTASAWATSYDIFEWATLLWNTVSATFTVVWASVWSHTYTVVAKNSWGSASWVSTTVNVTACLSAPWNVTGTINVYDSGTVTNYTCGLWFDVNFTDVSGATYYQLFEWATQIGSNSATSNFVVTGQTAGSHTYTIKACNWVWCSTGTNFTVSVAACVNTWSFGNWPYQFGTPWSSWATHQWLPWGAYVPWLGTDLNINNASYWVCFGWWWFTVPVTWTYTITHKFRVIQWLPWGWWNFWSQILEPSIPWSTWQFVAAIANWDTSIYTVTYTRSLVAWTCYVLDMWTDAGPNVWLSEVTDFTIS